MKYAYPAPTACAALAPIAWNARKAIKGITEYVSAQPIVAIMYNNVDNRYIARRP